MCLTNNLADSTMIFKDCVIIQGAASSLDRKGDGQSEKERCDLNWLNKLEKKFGRFALPNLTIYLIGAYIIGYGIQIVFPELLQWLVLNPVYIMRGQVWRLVSWILVPPSGRLFGIIIMLICFYTIGSSLERSWGTFRYNVYIFSGFLFTIVGAFVMYAYYMVTINEPELVSAVVSVYCMYLCTYYVDVSVFLALAATIPDAYVMFYFILPIKAKWLGVLDIVIVATDFLQGNAAVRIIIVASLLNFALFFFSSRNMKALSPKEQMRKHKFKKQVKRPKMNYGNGARHRCAVCGRTELDDPNLEFRFCSKCKGNYEYCNEHLFTHQHVS